MEYFNRGNSNRDWIVLCSGGDFSGGRIFRFLYLTRFDVSIVDPFPRGLVICDCFAVAGPSHGALSLGEGAGHVCLDRPVPLVLVALGVLLF